jgi:hypothetical protein
MADCKITHGQNKGFWIAESFMQLVLHYIYKEASKPQYTITNKPLFLEDMKFKIDGYANGYMTLGWGGFIESTVEKQTMIQILQNVKTTLQSKGINISVSELMSIPTADETLKYMLDKKPFPTAELIRVIDALIQILEGTWESTNYNMDLNWRYFD